MITEQIVDEIVRLYEADMLIVLDKKFPLKAPFITIEHIIAEFEEFHYHLQVIKRANMDNDYEVKLVFPRTITVWESANVT